MASARKMAENNKEYCKRYRDKYAERKRYQHLLTKLEKATVYDSRAENALSTSLLNRSTACFHQKVLS